LGFAIVDSTEVRRAATSARATTIACAAATATVPATTAATTTASPAATRGSIAALAKTAVGRVLRTALVYSFGTATVLGGSSARLTTCAIGSRQATANAAGVDGLVHPATAATARGHDDPVVERSASHSNV